MTLQARLTLSSVLITTVIVTIVSVVDLGNDMERQFEGTLRSAKSIRTAVSNLVRRTVVRDRTLSLRVVVAPAFIRNDIKPALKKNAAVAVFSVVGAVIITLIFSTLAFRSLGRLGKMLDLLASGQYDYPEGLAEAPAKTDEFGVMASK